MPTVRKKTVGRGENKLSKEKDNPLGLYSPASGDLDNLGMVRSPNRERWKR